MVRVLAWHLLEIVIQNQIVLYFHLYITGVGIMYYLIMNLNLTDLAKIVFSGGFLY